MVMRKIRQSKNTMRLPLIIMTIILAFGLVGSFALWSAPNLTSPTQVQPLTLEQKIANDIASIENLEEALNQKPKDFGILQSLANRQYDLGSLYVEANNTEKSTEVFAKAVENYLAALENAPENLNAEGKANILTDAAYCAWNSNQVDQAEALFKQAIEVDPKHVNAQYNYSIFLAFQKQNYDRAIDQLNNLKSILASDDPKVNDVNALIENIKGLSQVPANTGGDNLPEGHPQVNTGKELNPHSIPNPAENTEEKPAGSGN